MLIIVFAEPNMISRTCEGLERSVRDLVLYVRSGSVQGKLLLPFFRIAGVLPFDAQPIFKQADGMEHDVRLVIGVSVQGYIHAL